MTVVSDPYHVCVEESSRFLERERSVLRGFLPGLDERLESSSLRECEAAESPVVEYFRDAGGCGLIVPSSSGGLGADPVAAVRLQRALGSRSPSLAVATTMHHFSVATLVALSKAGAGHESLLLEAISCSRQLVASGFAEGKPGQGIFTSSLSARRGPSGTLLMSGVKKPCSLARSMDLLTVSLALPATGNGGRPELVVGIIPAKTPGISVQRFWRADVLRAAQSDAVVLTDVPVDSKALVHVGSLGRTVLDEVQATGLLWFTLLITASYLGAASAIIERALPRAGEQPTLFVAAVGELETAAAALEGIAAELKAGTLARQLLSRALTCRYTIQDGIRRAGWLGADLLGGTTFMSDPTIGQLLATISALAFHPPARGRNADALIGAMQGADLAIS